MKKRIIILVLSVVVCLGLCACGVGTGSVPKDTSSDTTDTEDSSEKSSETEKAPELQPADWKTMECTINGHKITLPCTYSEFVKCNYFYVHEDEDYTVSGYQSKQLGIVWGGTDYPSSNEDIRWWSSVYVYNAGDARDTMMNGENMYITGFLFNEMVSYGDFQENDKIVFPGGITSMSTRKDVITVYGEPTRDFGNQVVYEEDGKMLFIKFRDEDEEGSDTARVRYIEYKIDPIAGGLPEEPEWTTEVEW